MNLAETLSISARKTVDCEDVVECAAAFDLAESLLLLLGQEEYAEKLREVGHALGLDRMTGKEVTPESAQLATVLLNKESKRRHQREP